MANSAFSGLFDRPVLRRQGQSVEHVIVHRPLQRILAFTGHSIDHVINDPIVRRKILGYYKLNKQIERRMEIVELEAQWGLLGE